MQINLVCTRNGKFLKDNFTECIIDLVDSYLVSGLEMRQFVLPRP